MTIQHMVAVETDIPVITVQDPSDPFGMPIYDGPAKNAQNVLIPGVYAATTHLDTTGDEVDILLIVTPSVSYVTDTDQVVLSGRINAQ